MSVVLGLVGDGLHFDCKPENLEADVMWWKEGLPLFVDGRHYHVSSNGTLDVENAQFDDNALFSCTVQSRYGAFSRSFAVLLQGSSRNIK